MTQTPHESRLEIGTYAVGFVAVVYIALRFIAWVIAEANGPRLSVIDLLSVIIVGGAAVVVVIYVAGWVIVDGIPRTFELLADVFDAVTREPDDE